MQRYPSHDARGSDGPRRAKLASVIVRGVGLFTMFLVGLTLFVGVDLIGSATIRQVREIRSERAIVEAESVQEPYRGTDWGRQYWQELSRYRERWDPYVVYRVNDTTGQYLNVAKGIRRTYTSTATPPSRRPLV